MSLNIHFLLLLIIIIIFKQAYSKNKVLNKLRNFHKEENEKKITNMQNKLNEISIEDTRCKTRQDKTRYIEDLSPMYDEVNMLNDENHVAEKLG